MPYYGEDTTAMNTWDVLQVMFLEDHSEVIFPFVKTENDKIQFYQVKAYTKLENVFNPQNLIWSKECSGSGYDLKLFANKTMH